VPCNGPCAACAVESASDTIAAATNQAEFTSIARKFDQANCWGGEIASSPGAWITNLASRDSIASKYQICGLCDTSVLSGAVISAYPCNANATNNAIRNTIGYAALGLLGLLVVVAVVVFVISRRNKQSTVICQHSPLSSLASFRPLYLASD